MHIAQPAGCSPIASAIDAGDAEIHPCRPETVAHSLAIGTPGDGYLVIDAVRSRHGSAGSASDEEIFAGIDLLARTEGILTEPAGGTTIAVLRKLVQAGELDPDAVVVAIITGNGLKTLEDHPEKSWPTAECESEAMLSVLSDLQHEATGQPLPA
jgi:threonine synthase